MSAVCHILKVLLCVFLLAGCQEDAEDVSDADVAIPDILVPQRAACERTGGRWGKVPGRDAFTCFQTTRDANERCETARDCEGLCLARSRTCAPETPLFGCHEIVSAAGLRQTICTE